MKTDGCVDGTLINKKVELCWKQDFGEFPRWWHRKTPSSPPLMGTPELQILTEKLLIKKSGTY